jgi:hypothetical protein
MVYPAGGGTGGLEAVAGWRRNAPGSGSTARGGRRLGPRRLALRLALRRVRAASVGSAVAPLRFRALARFAAGSRSAGRRFSAGSRSAGRRFPACRCQRQQPRPARAIVGHKARAYDAIRYHAREGRDPCSAPALRASTQAVRL